MCANTRHTALRDEMIKIGTEVGLTVSKEPIIGAIRAICIYIYTSYIDARRTGIPLEGEEEDIDPTL